MTDILNLIIKKILLMVLSGIYSFKDILRKTPKQSLQTH